MTTFFILLLKIFAFKICLTCIKLNCILQKYTESVTGIKDRTKTFIGCQYLRKQIYFFLNQKTLHLNKSKFTFLKNLYPKFKHSYKY